MAFLKRGNEETYRECGALGDAKLDRFIRSCGVSDDEIEMLYTYRWESQLRWTSKTLNPFPLGLGTKVYSRVTVYYSTVTHSHSHSHPYSFRGN